MAVFSVQAPGIELDVSKTTAALLQKIVFPIIMQIYSKFEFSWNLARAAIVYEIEILF